MNPIALLRCMERKVNLFFFLRKKKCLLTILCWKVYYFQESSYLSAHPNRALVKFVDFFVQFLPSVKDCSWLMLFCLKFNVFPYFGQEDWKREGRGGDGYPFGPDMHRCFTYSSVWAYAFWVSQILHYVFFRIFLVVFINCANFWIQKIVWDWVNFASLVYRCLLSIFLFLLEDLIFPVDGTLHFYTWKSQFCELLWSSDDMFILLSHNCLT